MNGDLNEDQMAGITHAFKSHEKKCPECGWGPLDHVGGVCLDKVKVVPPAEKLTGTGEKPCGKGTPGNFYCPECSDEAKFGVHHGPPAEKLTGTGEKP